MPQVSTRGPVRVVVLKLKRFLDARGFLSETYDKHHLTKAGIKVDFVQDNLLMSHRPRTLRGLHFQREPVRASQAD
jgi:dTDP-4-dehydrorhamnose 3,5-epimerase